MMQLQLNGSVQTFANKLNLYRLQNVDSQMHKNYDHVSAIKKKSLFAPIFMWHSRKCWHLLLIKVYFHNKKIDFRNLLCNLILKLLDQTDSNVSEGRGGASFLGSTHPVYFLRQLRSGFTSETILKFQRLVQLQQKLLQKPLTKLYQRAAEFK